MQQFHNGFLTCTFFRKSSIKFTTVSINLTFIYNLNLNKINLNILIVPVLISHRKFKAQKHQTLYKNSAQTISSVSNIIPIVYVS